MWPLLENRRPPLDRDTYRILTKAVGQIMPCATPLEKTKGRPGAA